MKIWAKHHWVGILTVLIVAGIIISVVTVGIVTDWRV